MTSADHERGPAPGAEPPLADPPPTSPGDGPGAGVPQTGVAVVDDVLAGLGGIDRASPEERVPAFERAQEGLRGALDDDAGGDAGTPADSATGAGDPAGA